MFGACVWNKRWQYGMLTSGVQNRSKKTISGRWHYHHPFCFSTCLNCSQSSTNNAAQHQHWNSSSHCRLPHHHHCLLRLHCSHHRHHPTTIEGEREHRYQHEKPTNHPVQTVASTIPTPSPQQSSSIFSSGIFVWLTTMRRLYWTQDATLLKN